MSPLLGRGKGILGADITAPVVTITSPANGASITAATTLQATASDIGSGVKNVQWQVDGVNYGAVQTVAPYSVGFDPASWPVGSHTIKAIVTDNANRQSSSSIVVSVQNARVKAVARSTAQGTSDDAVVMQFDSVNVDQWGNGNGDGITYYIPAGMDGHYDLWFQVRQPDYHVVGWPNGWSGDGHGASWIRTNRYGDSVHLSWSGSDQDVNDHWMTNTQSGIYLIAGDWIQCWTSGAATGLGVINYSAAAQFTRTGA